MAWDTVAGVVLDNPDTTQLILFGTLLIGMWTIERVVHGQPTLAKLRHTSINVLFLAGVLPVQLTMMIGCIALAEWTQAHHFGLVYLLPHSDSIWIKYGLMFVVLDLLDYVYHYIAHRVPLMWRLHLVHHSDRAVDVSTTFREHPLETLVRVSFLTLCVGVCGATLPVLIMRQTVETFSNTLQHTTFRLPARPARVMGWLFVTSNLHHTHHHFQQPGTNCNYGDVFSIWDRLFGTYVEMDETVFGLDTHMSGANTGVLQLLGLGRLFPATATEASRRGAE
jgi:sterol desaturase/sphingolipid hydroxylase (fatty acid hydroxylase superfamily)